VRLQKTRLSRRPHSHLHSSLRCNQGARRDGVFPRPHVPHGRTHGPHAALRKPQAQAHGAATWRSATTFGTKRAAGAWSLTCPSRTTGLAQVATCSRMAHRETEAHFTATGMPSQRNQSDSFRFKRSAFYQSLKSKVGLAAAKAAALRINLNVEGCVIVAAPVHSPSRAHLLLPHLLSHNLPLPRIH